MVGWTVYSEGVKHTSYGDYTYAVIQSLPLTLFSLGVFTACCCKQRSGRTLAFCALFTHYMALIIFLAVFTLIGSGYTHFLDSGMRWPEGVSLTERRAYAAIGHIVATAVIDGWCLCVVGSWYY